MLLNNQLKSSLDVYDHSLAIEFYANVLNKVSPHSEFPIFKLAGHRGQAPTEVQRVAVNAIDLKRFLTRYPSIFTVTENNCVKLASTIANYKMPKGNTKSDTECSDGSDLAVQYYENAIKKRISEDNSTCLSLTSLIGYRSQAPPIVQNRAKNVNELYSFLSNHPDVFTVRSGKFVSLSRKSPSVTNDKNDASTPSYDETDSALAVEYYSKILNNTGPNYPINRLIGHRGQAPLKVKNVAYTDQDLKLFLSRFPNLFSITDNVVTLIKGNPHDSLEGKCDPDLAVKFYTDILKNRVGFGRECPIQKLTGYGSNAPLEVQNCARNPYELYKFFSKYPNVFTVTSKKSVMLKGPVLDNIVSKVKNLSLTPDGKKCNSTKAVDFYVSILRRWKPSSEIPITQVMTYLPEASVDVYNEARNEEELTRFFLKHPDIFEVVQNKFVKLIGTSIKSNNIIQSTNYKSESLEPVGNLNVNNNKARTLRYFPSLQCPQKPGFSGTWEDHVLDNTVLVTEVDECLDACNVIKKEKVIAFDCEGYNLGRGIISLIQIALVNGVVYIFDIYELPRMISLGLKEIIESDKILKVINYCRNDCLNLKSQYNVNLTYIFDVSVAYHVIEHKNMSLSNFKPAGLNQICAKYGVPTNTCKDDVKFIYITQPNYWLIRPLNMKMVSYAAFDVASQVPYLYCEFLKRMDLETEMAIWSLSQKMCIT